MLRLAPALLLVVASAAFALDKQGSAHGGSIAGASSGFNVSGAGQFGFSVLNPSYAARPDNTGLALFRYGAHFDFDVIGARLSFPVDVNFFTDRDQGLDLVLAPTEFDVIAGVSSTWGLGPGALELAVRFEHDRPIDRGTFTQTYVDARGRYLYSFAEVFPGLKDALRDGDVSGWATLGVFAFNPTYAARPDNSGLAFLRYALHGEVSALDDLFSVGLDATFFTDRTTTWVVPTELDFTVDLIVHRDIFEFHLAYERDMPLDRQGLVQQFVYFLTAVAFDLGGKPRATTDKQMPASP